MKIKFDKFHGGGNDFVMIDNREMNFDSSVQKVAALCHRRFGIGADGLILLENSDIADFRMRYFNADGAEASLCGNGSRCVVAFAHKLNVFAGENCRFEAFDGIHEARVLSHESESNFWIINLQMNDLTSYEVHHDGLFADTGSPHFVKLVSATELENFYEDAKRLRHDKRFKNGTNVDFYLSDEKNRLHVRTFERGVEDETLSCGTGVVATALMHAAKVGLRTGNYSQQLKTQGGDFVVDFTCEGDKFTNIHLTGNAVCVFSGKTDI